MKLVPDNRTGIIVPSRWANLIPRTAAHAYRNPNQCIRRIDALKSGEIPKILITRTQGGIGDVMMTLPGVKAISQKYNCKIDYGTDFGYLQGALPKVLEGIPYINEVKPWKEFDYESYDGVIDVTCPCITHEIQGAPPVNRIDLFARHMGVKLIDTQIDYIVKPEEIEWSNNVLQQAGINRFKKVIVQPFSSATNRNIPQSFLTQLVVGLTQSCPDVACMVFTHPVSDGTSVNWDILRTVQMRDYKVREIASFIYHADLVICPDSALLHIAGALKKPTLTFFGPTDARARVNHYPNAIAYCPGVKLSCFPCVVGDSLVLTNEGYKEIQDIKIQDLSKTSHSCYSSVTQLHCNDIGDRKLIDIKGCGVLPITVTNDHKVLVSTRRNEYKKGILHKIIDVPEWTESEKIKKGDYLYIPRNKKNSSKSSFLTTNLNSDDLPLELYWLIGLFIAKGYIFVNQRSYEIRFALDFMETQLISKIESIYNKIICRLFPTRSKGNITTHKNNKGESTIVCLRNKNFTLFMQELFGKRTKAITKKIPSFLFNANDNQIIECIEGMKAGDGHIKVRSNKYSTASKKLALGIQELYTRFGVLAPILHTKRNTNYKKNTDIYRIDLYDLPHNRIRNRWYVTNDYIITPITKVIESKRSDLKVYDITIPEDPTFTINNLAIYDCWYANSCRNAFTCWKMMNSQFALDTAINMVRKEEIYPHPDLIMATGENKLQPQVL